MARSEAAISIVQFDAQAIVRVRLRPQGEGVTVLAHDIAWGPWPEADDPLGAALAAFAKRLALHEDRIVSIVPRHELTTRLLDLPTQDPQEMASMLRFSAEEYVPFPMEEMVLGHTPILALPNGETRVLAAFAHRDVINLHMTRLQAAGLEPEHVYLSTACLIAAAQLARPGEAGRYALVNLAPGGIEGVVFDEAGLPALSRGVSIAHGWPQEGREAAEALGELAMEVRGTLAVFRRESLDGLGAEEVLVASDVAAVEYYAAGIAEETQKACGAAAFAAALAPGGAERLNTPVAVSLGAAMLALGRSRLAIDLLPRSVADKRSRAVVRRLLLRAALFAAGFLAALGVLYWQAVQQREAYIAELDAQLAELRPQAEGIASKRAQLNLIKQQVQRNESVLALLAALAEAAPEEGINISRLVYSSTGGVDVYGRGISPDHVMRYTDAVRDVASLTFQQLRRASREYESKTMERDKYVFDYKITVPFQEEKKVAEDAAP